MNLHQDLIVIDGLIVSNFSRPVFEDMRHGGVTAANCTCSVWEGFQATMDNIASWKRHFRDNDDLLLEVRTTTDVGRAKETNKTGIILGFQNGAAFEGNLGYVELFKQLGIGIVQLTYNTQNLIGTGCYEPDSGLSGYGHEIIAEMNRVGVLIDLSHVGPKTSEEAIKASVKPVTYSHCLPAGLKQHPRNKSDDQLKFIVERGGFVGVTMFPPFLPKGASSTVDDYVKAIDYVVNLVGVDHVGIGTDFTQGHGSDFFQWISHDKGYGRRLVDLGEIVNPEGIRTIGEFPNITAAMERAGWNEPKIRKIMGENWLRVLADAWGENSS